ncbi:MAG TPA: hypothetical protein VHN77_08200 [Phycisphaerales bacterium]|nr:hypothetical protein [Phycisphaerales bacterium]
MHCCTPVPSAQPPRAHAQSNSYVKPTRRLAAAVQWAIPLTTLALIPKCPACIAGYVLLFTGLGLSLPAAATIRWTIITFCVTALVILAVRWLLNFRAKPQPHRPHPSTLIHVSPT